MEYLARNRETAATYAKSFDVDILNFGSGRIEDIIDVANLEIPDSEYVVQPVVFRNLHMEEATLDQFKAESLERGLNFIRSCLREIQGIEEWKEVTHPSFQHHSQVKDESSIFKTRCRISSRFDINYSLLSVRRLCRWECNGPVCVGESESCIRVEDCPVVRI